MKIAYSNHFKSRLKKRIDRDNKLKEKIGVRLKLLQSNLDDSSLKVHKLKGKRIDQYSFWIEGNLRITFIKIEGKILLTDIINHDEYSK